jgi:hypothetical protein
MRFFVLIFHALYVQWVFFSSCFQAWNSMFRRHYCRTDQIKNKATFPRRAANDQSQSGQPPAPVLWAVCFLEIIETSITRSGVRSGKLLKRKGNRIKNQQTMFRPRRLPVSRGMRARFSLRIRISSVASICLAKTLCDSPSGAYGTCCKQRLL